VKSEQNMVKEEDEYEMSAPTEEKNESGCLSSSETGLA